MLHIYVYVCVCAYTWVYVTMCGSQIFTLVSFLIGLYLIFSMSGSFWGNLVLIYLAWPSVQWTPGMHLTLLSQLWNYRWVIPHQLFCGSWGHELNFVIVWQAHYYLSHLSSHLTFKLSVHFHFYLVAIATSGFFFSPHNSECFLPVLNWVTSSLLLWSMVPVLSSSSHCFEKCAVSKSRS